MPTYNRANLLKRAIDSVINQTYKNWELLIVDNFSTDHTDEVLKSYKDSRISIFKIHNTGVIAKSRNIGIKKSSGEWIAFLDSDDWWIKSKLEICFRNINLKTDLIYHKLLIKKNNQNNCLFNKSLTSKKLNKPIMNNLLLNGNLINNSSVVVRKKIIQCVQGISEKKELIAAEDYNLWLKISEITENFKFINKNLGYYFIHEKNILREDMSIPTREASMPYIKILSYNEKKLWHANLEYMSARYYYLIKDYEKAKFLFKSILSKLDNQKKIKTLFMLLMIFAFNHNQ